MCTWGVALLFKFILKTIKHITIYIITSPIIKYNIIQRAKIEIDNTLLKDEDFHKYLLYHTKFDFILKRTSYRELRLRSITHN